MVSRLKRARRSGGICSHHGQAEGVINEYKRMATVSGRRFRKAGRWEAAQKIKTHPYDVRVDLPEEIQWCISKAKEAVWGMRTWRLGIVIHWQKRKHS